MEVKGVTLGGGRRGHVPRRAHGRGIKHLHGLARASETGYLACVLFVIQMKGVHRFTPNYATHAAFGRP